MESGAEGLGRVGGGGGALAPTIFLKHKEILREKSLCPPVKVSTQTPN